MDYEQPRIQQTQWHTDLNFGVPSKGLKVSKMVLMDGGPNDQYSYRVPLLCFQSEFLQLKLLSSFSRTSKSTTGSLRAGMPDNGKLYYR